MNIRLPKVGDHVNVIEKRNYESGKLTTGVVKRLLSNPAEVHPRGNKVELSDGTVGRLASFVDEVGKQDFIDPALREQLAQEIKSQKPAGGDPASGGRNQGSDRREGSQGFQNRPDRRERRFDRPAPVPEPPVNLSDLPGEDDLR